METSQSQAIYFFFENEERGDKFRSHERMSKTIFT